MNRRESGSWAMVCALGILGFGSFAGAETKKPAGDKIPITTSSDEARQAYLKGRDLDEKLRATDARKLFEQAVAKDKDFALAHLALAHRPAPPRSSSTSLAEAVTASAKVSEGERLLIQGAEAGARGNPAVQKRCSSSSPAVPQRRTRPQRAGPPLLRPAGLRAGDRGVRKGRKINPSFSPPYNQMGYAYRFTEKNPQAEEAFKKYIAAHSRRSRIPMIRMPSS